MFRSLMCKFGLSLKRTTAIVINGESSSSTAKYLLFTAFQNQNVAVISNSRVVTSTFSSFSTTTNLRSSDSDYEFIVSYLVNSCGLSKNQAIDTAEKINFKTTNSNPDSVLALLKSYEFTESHISKLISRRPSVLLSNPHITLKPKLDFFKSKGIYGVELANFISNHPFLTRSSNNEIIPSFDILKSIVHSDQNVIKLIKRNYWILNTNLAKKVMVNLEVLRNQGVPQTNFCKYLIKRPGVFAGDAKKFKRNVDKVKEIGFDPLKPTFLIALDGLTSMSEANWKKKMDVYKRWGWSEDHIHTAFRKNPNCVMASEKKIMSIMNFLVNDMGYESLSIAKTPRVFTCSLKERIFPRCSVIRILVSKGLIQENIPISSLSQMVDKPFLEKYVKMYEQEVPELMKVFQGELNYQDLLQNEGFDETDTRCV